MADSGPHRILITGSRAWTDWEAVWKALDDAIDQAGTSGKRDFTVVHGACPKGADQLAADFCEDQAGWHDNAGRSLAEERHPADWDKYGKAAGFRRNAEMVNLGADLCLAFILDGSRGASHTADLAEKAGIPVVRHERSSRG